VDVSKLNSEDVIDIVNSGLDDEGFSEDDDWISHRSWDRVMGRSSSVTSTYKGDPVGLWCIETVYPSDDEDDIIIDTECCVEFTEDPRRIPLRNQWNPILRDKEGCIFNEYGDVWYENGFSVECKKRLSVSDLKGLSEDDILNKVMKANAKTRVDAQDIAETVRDASV